MGINPIMLELFKREYYSFVRKAFSEVDNSIKFKANWHIELICDKLQQCVEGGIKRLIINIPPRNLKSFCASIALPAYILGRKPFARIIGVSYDQNLSNKSSRKVRQTMETEFYKKTFPQARIGKKDTENEFETTKNGGYFATSIDGALTGLGGDYIIIDDPIKAGDALSDVKRGHVNDWYDNTLISRLNDKVNGVIIVVMQRLHIDDLTGHLLKQKGWEVLSLPAIAEEDEQFTLSNGRIVGRKAGEALNPSLEGLENLEQNKEIMSNYNFSAQYQQNPIPAKGNVIDFDNFGYFDRSEFPSKAMIYQSWDIALKDGKNNDFSVCITAGFYNGVLYINDIQRFKLGMPLLVNKMNELYFNQSCNHLIIEDSSISTSLIQCVQKEKAVYPILYKPQDNKISRANNAALFIRSDRVRLLKNASWLDDFRAEINAFPNGKHDDQVDALSQLINIVANGQNIFSLVDIAAAMNRSKQKKPYEMTKTEFCEKVRSKCMQRGYRIPRL